HNDPTCSQGLSYHGGFLYESTGLTGGKSSVRRVEVVTGKVLVVATLGEQYLGEGMVIFNNEIISLTWQSKKGFIWDLETLELKGDFSF
ncbi:unnamed protein product, partial [Discosporangium mesarthrocarpum]